MLLILFCSLFTVSVACFHSSAESQTQFITVIAEKGTIKSEVHFSGKVDFPNSEREVFLSSGKIGEIFVEEGQNVKKGELLAKLSRADIVNFESEVERLEAEYQRENDQLDPDISNSLAAKREDAVENYEYTMRKWLGINLQDDEKLKQPDILFKDWGITDLRSIFDVVSDSNVQNNPDTRWDESVVFEWVSVYPGDFLAVCDQNDPEDPNTACARSEIDNAWQTLKRASEDYARQRITLSAAEKSLEKANNDISDAQIVSKTTGRVLDVNMEVGDNTSGDKYINIENSEIVEVDATIPEVLVSKVKEDMEISILVNAYPDVLFDGFVKKIGIAEGSSFKITATFKSPGEALLRDGMNAFCTATLWEYKDVIIVPTVAVYDIDTEPYVNIPGVEGEPIKLPVTTGMSNDSSVVIESGIEEGQVILVELADSKPLGPDDF